MCGIFAYTGNKNAIPILIDGLTSLEYRGYDSAGIHIPQSGTRKAVGGVSQLKLQNINSLQGTSGVAHLRWATHGEPTEINAHPHHDMSHKIHVVHNGIIENYKEIKESLISQGYTFVSSTDTEVIPQLIAFYLYTLKDFEKAVFEALNILRGTYGIAVTYENEPQKIITARCGAPAVLGLGMDENFVASDPTPILRHTKNVIYLSDGEVAIITPQTHAIYNLKNIPITKQAEVIDWDVEQVQKNGFDHFMLKEIMEAKEVVQNTIRGRIKINEGLVKLGGLELVEDKLKHAKRIIIVGCGTAFYAGLVGEYMLEEHAGILVEVEVGSEFRYRKPILDEHTILLAISQSGETADTLEAIREAKRKGALTLGIVNTVGSTIARETDAGIYNHAGPEIGVASTKAFISQLTALVLFTVFMGRTRSMDISVAKEILNEITTLPDKIEKILLQKDTIKSIAEKYSTSRDFLYIGRKYNYPIAFEGALKLKEVSYIHAEGYGAGEMKHGPLAMIGQDFPSLAITLQDSVYEKMISNIQEIKARKGKIISIATEGDRVIQEYSNDVIYVPSVHEMLSPILAIIPLQLFAYYFAVTKGLDVDKPRNLAKSVTVE